MKQLTDKEIVEKLLERDPIATRWFYYVKCRPLFLSLMKKLFNHPIEYDEFVDEVVVFLMENDDHRLKSFDFQSTFMYWLQRCLVRHFIRNGQVMIDDTSKEPPYPIEGEEVDLVSQINAKLDLETLLKILAKDNPRHSYVIKRILLDDAEFKNVASEIKVQVSNLYNIKKRAIEDLTVIALGIKKDKK